MRFFLCPHFSPRAQVVAVASQCQWPVCPLAEVYFCRKDTQRCEGKSAECWIFNCDWAQDAFHCPFNPLHFPRSWINQLQPLQHTVKLSVTPTFVLLTKLESSSAQQQTNPDSRRAPEIAPLLWCQPSKGMLCESGSDPPPSSWIAHIRLSMTAT